MYFGEEKFYPKINDNFTIKTDFEIIKAAKALPNFEKLFVTQNLSRNNENTSQNSESRTGFAKSLRSALKTSSILFILCVVFDIQFTYN